MILAVNDYIAITLKQFIKHLTNCFTCDKYPLLSINNDKNFSTIYGYSCRSLFEITLKYYNTYSKYVLNRELIILTTPIHHTSYRNIIEKYIRQENIYIMKMDTSMTKITQIPKLKYCDLIIVTHIFGIDIDLSILNSIKKELNPIIIEDRVQGSKYTNQFSNKNVDISLYSMGMDKRPIALGGGYMFIKNDLNAMISYIIKKLNNYHKETRLERITFLVKKIPTYLIYNYRLCLRILFIILNFLQINVYTFAQLYRKNNPGFTHDNYLIKPSDPLLKSIYENFNTHENIELFYKTKFSLFISYIDPLVKNAYFPWINNNICYTPYNTILIPWLQHKVFFDYFNNKNISIITNPTYKIFNKSYPCRYTDNKFNNSLIYLPSVANMTEKEMNYLANKINTFYFRYN